MKTQRILQPVFKAASLSVFIVSLLLCFSSIKASAQQDDETLIREILAEQVTAWNKGDVVEFMKGYWNNDSLTFVGKNGVTYGYNATLENYKKNYPNKSAMGTLQFDLLQFKRLAADLYFVIGKWHLQRSAGDIGGHYTLLFKKINNVWKIISDHSS